MRVLFLVVLFISPLLIFSQADSSILVIKENPHNMIMMSYDGGSFLGPNNQNVFIGEEAGVATSGLGNTFLGRRAGKTNTNQTLNTYLGKSAGESANGSINTFIGNQAGENSTGDKNIFIGPSTGDKTTGNSNIFIGFNAGKEQSGSNQLIIENSLADSTEMLIYGQFDNDILRFNAHTDIFSDNSSDEGLRVEKTHFGNSDIPAIRGINQVSDFYGIGVQGIGGYKGVEGLVQGTGQGLYYGVVGGSNGNNLGINYGVYAFAQNANINYSLYSLSQGGINNYAGYFDGQVFIRQKPNDNMYFQVQNNLGENVLSVGDDDVVEVNRFKTNWFSEMDSLKTSVYTDLTNVTTNVTANGNTDLEIESGKRINKATSMKYYICINGSFPSNSSFIDGLLLGEIKLFPYNFTPGGWLPCEGQILNIIDNQALFALIGSNYGGNGTTTFALPDMRNAVPHHN